VRTDCGGDGEDVVEVRCPNAPSVLHFKVINRNTIEVKCKNKRCTGGGETVVLHRYSFPELELIQTLRFQDPEAARARNTRKENP
jgi:hypothetical protein